MQTAELIEREYGDVTVGAVAVVVDFMAANEDGLAINPLMVGCSDPRVWVQSKLLDRAATQLEAEDEASDAAVEEANEADD